MSTANWLTLITILAAAVTAIIAAQRHNIEAMVGRRLDDLQAGMDDLNRKSDDHGNRITRVETVLELNGCIDFTGCDRRKREV